MIDQTAALVSLALTILGAVVGIVAWTHSRFERTAKEARDYADHAITAAREHTRDVYARREDQVRIEAKVDALVSLVVEIRDRLFKDGRDPAE